MRAGRLQVVAMLFCLGTVALRARADEQEPPADSEATGPPLRLVLPSIVQVKEISDERHGKAFALIGSMEFERAGIFSLRAQRAVIWLDPRVDTGLLKMMDALKGEERVIPIWALRAVYAEGGRVPALFQAGGRIVRASSLYYDFRAHEGVFLDAELRMRRTKVGPLEEDLPDFVFRAAKMRATGPGSWSARDVTLTSTDYVKPEVSLKLRRLRIDNEVVSAALGRIMLLSLRHEKDGGGPSDADLEAVAEELADPDALQSATKGRLDGVRAVAFRVPFFAWKSINIDGAKMENLIARVSVGQKGSIGNGVYLGGGKKSKPLGWYVGAGYFNNRGPLVDGEFWVDAWDKRLTGRTVGAYFRDHGTDFDGTTAPSRDRFWVQNRYRFEWTDRLRFDMELTFLSDDNFLRIYDEREFKEGKDQESLGYLRYKDDALYATLIYKWQSMDFLETKEQLPSGALSVPNYTLLRLGEDGKGRPILLQVALDAELGNLNFRQAEGSPDSDFRTARFDVDPTLYVAFNVGAVRFTPFGRFRFTGYEHALDSSSEARYAGSAGLRADVQFGRWFGDVQHVVNLAIEYEDLYSVTTPADELFQMDGIDAVTPWEGLGIRMRNRFLKRDGALRRQFLNFDLFYTWFPEERAPLGVVTDGFVELDLEWFPSYQWLVEVRGQYDYGDGRLATGSVEGRYIPNDELSFWGSLRHLDQDSDVVTGGSEFMVDSRWRFVLFSQYDIRNQEALDQALLIQRMGQTFMVGVNVRYKVGENRFTFSIKFDLLERFRSEKRKKAAEDLRREVFFPSGP